MLATGEALVGSCQPLVRISGRSGSGTQGHAAHHRQGEADHASPATLPALIAIY
jgi:hypothetical protein